MLSLPRRIAIGLRAGLIAGLALGLLHTILLAGGGLFAMSGAGEILGSFARYCGLFALMGGFIALAVNLVVGLLPRRWSPAPFPLVVFALAILYVIPWIAVLAKEKLNLRLGIGGTAAAGAVILVLGLGLLYFLAVAASRRRGSDRQEPQGAIPWRSALILLLAAAGLSLIPLAVRDKGPTVDPALLEGRRLEPLRDRALAAFADKRWNVLLVTIDALRADHLGCYGYPRPTSPTIDSLAQAGMRFERAFCQRPSTSPNFATLFTGLYLTQHGVHHTQEILDERLQTMAEIFSQAGWHTAGVITNGNLHPEFGFSQGFEDYVYGHSRAGDATDRALEWLQANGSGPRPWFLWIHYLDPHTPYDPGPPHDAIIGRGREETNRHQRMIDLYDGEVRYTDDQLRRLFTWLADTGVDGHTVIVLTADHGESLGEHGQKYKHGMNPYEPTARVPLIFCARGVIPAGQACAAVVGTVDLLPTLLDATGLPTPTEVAGRSLLPNLLGMATDGPRDFAITYAGALPYSGPGLTRALRRQGTKYVQRMTGWARLPRGPLEVLWSFNALAEGSLADDEYYDLTADPGETRNLIRSRRDAARLDKQVLEAFVDYLGAEAPESRLIRPEDLTPEALQSLRDLGYIR